MEFTGERFVPEAMSGELIEAEHQARYRLAMQVAASRDVLDAACGVGWGSALLAEAGATSVTGVDIDDDAVAASRTRSPQLTFTQADVAKLPFDDDSFDLVTCFETIEHVEDPEVVLDELQRVLRPGGLLMVSSPNPGVYPAGNPFHIRELTSEELQAAAGSRFANTQVWRQHDVLASTLFQDGLDAWTVAPVSAVSVSDLGAGTEPYSLVIASDDSIPSLDPAILLAPTDVIDAVNEEARRMEEDRASMVQDQRRIVEERDVILAERVDLHRQLKDAAAGLEQLSAERDRAGLLLFQAEQRVAELTAESESLRLALEARPTIATGTVASAGRRSRWRRDRGH